MSTRTRCTAPCPCRRAAPPWASRTPVRVPRVLPRAAFLPRGGGEAAAPGGEQGTPGCAACKRCVTLCVWGKAFGCGLSFPRLTVGGVWRRGALHSWLGRVLVQASAANPPCCSVWEAAAGGAAGANAEECVESQVPVCHKLHQPHLSPVQLELC